MSDAPTVISLGGSLIVPDEVDVGFLRSFVSLIRHHVSRGRAFVIITGGGAVARRYQAAAAECGSDDSETLDWVGIHATRFNARFLQSLMTEIAHEEIVTVPDPSDMPAAVILGGGGTPGCSTDGYAVSVGASLGASEIINLSNARYVYDKDPKKYDDAAALYRLTWGQYRALIPEEWDPGLSTPFDPVASREAQECGMTVVIAGGDMDNLDAYLKTGTVEGTIIE